jgi:hypothetical protein
LICFVNFSVYVVDLFSMRFHQNFKTPDLFCIFEDQEVSIFKRGCWFWRQKSDQWETALPPYDLQFACKGLRFIYTSDFRGRFSAISECVLYKKDFSFLKSTSLMQEPTKLCDSV